MVINKIIAVEGLDKTGKSTFCNAFEGVYSQMQGINGQALKKYSFPNASSPIGARIRAELETSTPNPDIVNTPNFLSEMSHYWMEELFNNTATIAQEAITRNSVIMNDVKVNNVNYLFDRYFISTLAYQAFYNNSRVDLDFIKTALRVNQFIKMPTDIIFLDLPNEEILRRTVADQEAGLNDGNDTLDVDVLNKRRDAYIQSLNFLKSNGVTVHWFEDSSIQTPEDLSKVLMGKIFR